MSWVKQATRPARVTQLTFGLLASSCDNRLWQARLQRATLNSTSSSELAGCAMKVLIVYGTKMGGTSGIATTMSEAFLSCGVQADVARAADAAAPRSYDAVLIGSGLYAGRWRRAARHFVLQNTKELLDVPTWLFSSGPLDDSALRGEIPPSRQVAQLIKRVGARGHMTFGGRLLPDARGFPASAMARTHAGDWRDAGQIQAWVQRIVEELRLHSMQARPVATVAAAWTPTTFDARPGGVRRRR